MAQTRPSTTAPRLPQQANREAQAVADAVELLQRQVKSALEQALAQPLCVPAQPLAAGDAIIVPLAYAATRLSFKRVGLVAFAGVAANATDYKTFQLFVLNVDNGSQRTVSSVMSTAAVGLSAYVARWFQGVSATLAKGELLAVTIQTQGAGVLLPSFAVIGE